MSNSETIRDLILALQMAEAMEQDPEGFIQGLLEEGKGDHNSTVSTGCTIRVPSPSSVSWFWCFRSR